MNMTSKGQIQGRALHNIKGQVKFVAKTYCWQSKTALLMALGMTSTAAVPLLISTPTMAGPYVVGQLSQSSQVIVAAGTTIPIRYDAAETIIMTPKETVPVTLIVATNIRSNQQRILIPQGSQVKGQLRPVSGGAQFFAQELILANSNQRLPIDARSEIIAQTKTTNPQTSPNIFKDAAVGAGAGALLGAIFGGRVGAGQVLAGAGIGGGVAALEQRPRETELVVIDPDAELHLTLQTDLVVSR